MESTSWKTNRPGALAALLTVLLSATASAQETPPTPAPEAPPPPISSGQVQTPQPQAAPPAENAPETANLPPPATAGTSPTGQWVYTSQYGWVYMPYGSSYTYAPTVAGGDPYQYVYYPAWGWRWIAAPWVFGIGPRPYFGVYGYAHYGWYGRPWFGHPWWGFHRGYPGGYRGVVVRHPYVGRHPYYGAPVYRGNVHTYHGHSH
jgi:hypothetical protein